MGQGNNGDIDVYASLPGGCPPIWGSNPDGFGVYSAIGGMYIGFTDLNAPPGDSHTNPAEVSEQVRRHSC